MPLPELGALGGAPLTVVVFGPGHGESIVVRVEGPEGVVWAVVDSASRQYRTTKVNPALTLLKESDAQPSIAVLTHHHQDHVKGFADLVVRAGASATFGVLRDLLPSDGWDRPTLSNPDDVTALKETELVRAQIALTSVIARGGREWDLAPDSTRDLGTWSLTALHPPEAERAAAKDKLADGDDIELNDLSSALELTHPDGAVVVLGADTQIAGWAAIEARRSPDHFRAAPLLKVSHHGSQGAIQGFVVDPTQPEERLQIVTPFPSSGKLPRFEDGEGAADLIAAATAFDLTALPSDLIPVVVPQGGFATVTRVDLRGAYQPSLLPDEDDPLLAAQPVDAPAPSGLEEGLRDPHETWVAVQLSTDGAVLEVWRGAHAVRVV